MKKFLWNKCMEFSISLIAIFFICYLPFKMNKSAAEWGFTYTFKDTISQLLNPNQLLYFNQFTGIERPLFPDLWERYLYTMELLAIGFLIAVILALVLVFLYSILNTSLQRGIKAILKVIESIPDLMFVIILQLLLLQFFKITGIKITNLYAFGDERVYFIPLISLSVIPAIMMYKMMILALDEEFEKTYVEYAYAKGLSRRGILFKHMFRNILLNLLYHSKTILLFMLSTLFVVEGLCNINGFMTFIVNGALIAPSYLILWVCMLFIPFYILFTIFEVYIAKITGVFTS